jgi:hypothetical protein
MTAQFSNSKGGMAPWPALSVRGRGGGSSKQS